MRSGQRRGRKQQRAQAGAAPIAAPSLSSVAAAASPLIVMAPLVGATHA
jgi:hypothetical protein